MRIHPWAVLLLGAVLLTSGCVTLAPQPRGSISGGPRALSALRETGGITQLEVPASVASSELGEQARLHRRRSARGLGLDAALASEGTATQGPPFCGGEAVPRGWPDFSSGDSEALLTPFLTCTSPAEVLALQERVDMPRLVEALDDWSAVRLGALGPVCEDAVGILNSKRASFIVDATEDYGAAHAEVFVRFLADSSFDDDLREILFRLSHEKRLETTLGLMPQARGVCRDWAQMH